MIRGAVTAQREATIVVEIEDATGLRTQISAVIDTGFNGWLTLPADIAKKLGAEFVGDAIASLADGSEVVCQLYEVWIIWNGRRCLIEVDSADTTPLVGMQLFEGFVLRIDAWIGGQVVISPRKPRSKRHSAQS